MSPALVSPSLFLPHFEGISYNNRPDNTTGPETPFTLVPIPVGQVDTISYRKHLVNVMGTASAEEKDNEMSKCIPGLEADLYEPNLRNIVCTAFRLAYGPLLGYYQAVASNIGYPGSHQKYLHNMYHIAAEFVSYVDKRHSTLPRNLPVELIYSQSLEMIFDRDGWPQTLPEQPDAPEQLDAIEDYFLHATKLVYLNEVIRIQFNIHTLNTQKENVQDILREFLGSLAIAALNKIPIPVHIQVIFKGRASQRRQVEKLLDHSYFDPLSEAHYAKEFKFGPYEPIIHDRICFRDPEVNHAVSVDARLHVAFMQSGSD